MNLLTPTFINEFTSQTYWVGLGLTPSTTGAIVPNSALTYLEVLTYSSTIATLSGTFATGYARHPVIFSSTFISGSYVLKNINPLIFGVANVDWSTSTNPIQYVLICSSSTPYYTQSSSGLVDSSLLAIVDLNVPKPVLANDTFIIPANSLLFSVIGE